MKKILMVLLSLIIIYNFMVAEEKSSYPLPNDNVYSQYIYISINYEKLLAKSKSHPMAVEQLKDPYSPILFYQNFYDEFSACSYLHEGSPLVKIDKSKNLVNLFEDTYQKIKIDKTVENTISNIIIKYTFLKKHYESNQYKIDITDQIYVNNIKAKIVIDIGGGYNNMKQTMILTEEKVNGYFAFAIIEENGLIKLTPLITDDIIPYNSGKTYILK